MTALEIIYIIFVTIFAFAFLVIMGTFAISCVLDLVRDIRNSKVEVGSDACEYK